MEKNKIRGVINRMPKGVPKRDGSGKGRRANRGRGGCTTTQTRGKGRKGG